MWPRLPLCPSASPRTTELLPLAVPVPTSASHPLKVPSCHPSVVPTIGTTSKPVTLVQGCLPSVKLAVCRPGVPGFHGREPGPCLGWGSVCSWLPWPGAWPVSGWFRCWLPQRGARVWGGRWWVSRRSRGPRGRVLGAAMCVRRRVHDSFQSSFSPHKIFILVVQGPVIAISHPELFIPCTD